MKMKYYSHKIVNLAMSVNTKHFSFPVHMILEDSVDWTAWLTIIHFFKIKIQIQIIRFEKLENKYLPRKKEDSFMGDAFSITQQYLGGMEPSIRIEETPDLVTREYKVR